jgi:hypothetical protein
MRSCKVSRAVQRLLPPLLLLVLRLLLLQLRLHGQAGHRG